MMHVGTIGDVPRKLVAGLLVSLLWGGFSCAEPQPLATASTDLQAMLNRAVTAFEQAQAEQDDNPERARQLFRSAAQAFEAIVAAGVHNGRIEYNLGNAYFQAGDIGRAILHYRRAQEYRPRDPLIMENLREAQSRSLTTIRPSSRSAMLHSIFFWHYQTSAGERLMAGAFCWVGLWFLLALRVLVPWRWTVVAAGILGFVCLVSLGSAAATRWENRHAPAGVVLDHDVTVYKGPGKTYQRQFEQPLQPGVEFTVRERRAGWWNVELADGNRGWIESEQAALVTPEQDTASLAMSSPTPLPRPERE
ncbi:MAG: hypothetical protein J5J06_16575 [Phycisphaerae bacterium]|nr:hypothetical protein [Phycisphaerae bacterium]